MMAPAGCTRVSVSTPPTGVDVRHNRVRIGEQKVNCSRLRSAGPAVTGLRVSML